MKGSQKKQILKSLDSNSKVREKILFQKKRKLKKKHPDDKRQISVRKNYDTQSLIQNLHLQQQVEILELI